MAEKSPDDIQAEVLQWLRLVDLDVLQGFCDELKVTIPVSKQGNKSLIIKLLVRHLHSEATEALEDQGESIFLKLHSDMEEDLKTKGVDIGIPTEKVNPGEIQMDRKPDIKIEPGARDFITKVQKLREFKISGSIGGDGQKDTLSYASLAFQMKRGKDDGYSYNEIQGAVIKAIKPGNNLRNYLESRAELSEKAFFQILRSHFKEKDSTLVFHDLSNAAQLPFESEMDFCLRVMSLRERVVTLSAEEGFSFDSILLIKRFFHTLFTGFKNDNIRLELQTILKSGTISDEDLLHEISLVMSTEQERLNKLKSKVVVKEVTCEKSNSFQNIDNSSNKEIQKKRKENPLLIEINKLTVKVSELVAVRDEIKELKNQIQINNKNGSCATSNSESNVHSSESNVRTCDSGFRLRPRQRVFRCHSCERTNKSYCHHCFSCGGTDHRKNECKNMKKNF